MKYLILALIISGGTFVSAQFFPKMKDLLEKLLFKGEDLYKEEHVLFTKSIGWMLLAAAIALLMPAKIVATVLALGIVAVGAILYFFVKSQGSKAIDHGPDEPASMDTVPADETGNADKVVDMKDRKKAS